MFVSTFSFSQETNKENIKKNITRIENEIKLKSDSLNTLIKEFKYYENLELLSEIKNEEGVFPINAAVRSEGKVRKSNNLFSEIITAVNQDEIIELIDYDLGGYWTIRKGELVGYLSELFIVETKQISLAKEIIVSQKEKSIKSLIDLDAKNAESALENERNAYFNECNYTTDGIDEFTGKRRKITKYYSVDKFNVYGASGLRIRFRKNGNTKYLQIESAADLGCTSSYSTDKSHVKFKLENGDIVTFYHIDDVNCSNFELLGKLTESDIQRLKKSPIKTVRLTGTKSYFDIKDIFFKEFFIKKLDCIK